MVEEESYLIHLYRYIESNPVRAGMVSDPADYSWSSYQINALGKKSPLCTSHPQYLGLGKNKLARLEAYRELFKDHVDTTLITDIRESTNRGMAIGSREFKLQIEKLTGKRMLPAKRGRPLGWRKAKT